MLNAKDETGSKIPEQVSELSVPDRHFGQQTHTHYLVTGETAQTNQIVDFLTGRILATREQQSQQHQNLSTQVSPDNSLPLVEQTPRNQKSDSNYSINRQVEAIAGIATQQQLQATTMLRPVTTNTIIFIGENEKFELFVHPFHTMTESYQKGEKNCELTTFMLIHGKKALQTFGNKSASNTKTLDDLLIVLQRKYVKPESQATAKHKGHKLTLDPNTKSLSDILKNSTNVLKERLVTTHKT